MIGHVLVNTDEVMTNNYQVEHQALDLIGNGNSISDVISLEDGVVELVVSDVINTDRNSKGTASYGNFVKIRHENGKKTLYAHLKYGSVNVKKGEKVNKGEKLGTMGATGNAYGVHLHFEVRNQDESRENPYEYLWGQKQIKEKNKMNEEILEKPAIQKKEEVLKENIKVENKEEIKKEDDEIKNERNNEVIKKEDDDEEQIIKSTSQENLENDEHKLNKIEKSVNTKNEYLENKNYSYYSIVDALKEINIDSSFEYRSMLALKNGINNYRGSAYQNLKLLDLLKQGKLLSV